MNHSSEFAALRRQNKLLSILLAVLLILTLVSAAASVLTLVCFLNIATELQDALSRLDIDQINQALDTISTLTDLMNRIANLFGG